MKKALMLSGIPKSSSLFGVPWLIHAIHEKNLTIIAIEKRAKNI